MLTTYGFGILACLSACSSFTSAQSPYQSSTPYQSPTPYQTPTPSKSASPYKSPTPSKSASPYQSPSSSKSTSPYQSPSPSQSPSPYQTPLPTVDLGYELHQAIAFNQTGNYYNFSNIRYAAPPTGNLRFRAPKSPSKNRRTVQTGAQARICPQAAPAWISTANTWITQYLEGQNITLTASAVAALNDSLTIDTVPAQAADATEDCLFLDVMVPKPIFDKGLNNKAGSAVMVWIYGGGYTLGSKAGSGNPAGLLQRSMTHGREGVIYVAMNYRLGAFGWLAGPTVTADGVGNAGLYDQRFALEWVQNNIHLFGGDPNRVTVFGESAGGGSIMHQITAYGGNPPSPSPFQRAILQSPGFLPQTSAFALQNQYLNFLNIANATSLSDLRKLPSSVLVAANTLQIFQSNFGGFSYGPAVDGTFVPALPGKLLADGAFDMGVEIMVGHNLDEGLLFTDPLDTNAEEFMMFLRTVMPDASDAVLNYIATELYPAVYNGTYGYTDPIARTALLMSEWIFTCNTNYLDRAKNNRDYSYYFTTYPGLHGMDIAYTYYNSDNPAVNATVAYTLQDWLTTFAESGVPKTPDVSGTPKFIMYGANATVVDLGPQDVSYVMDPASNARCVWWQKGLYK